MGSTFDLRDVVRRSVSWVLSQGIWIVYKFDSESEDGPRHVLRAGIAAFDDDDLPIPFFLSRHRRGRQLDEEPDFENYER